jgi:hypothetical protein
MAVRREVFEKVGGFDEDFFSYYEDVDLCWRLWVLGYKVWFAPRSVAYHRHHGYWSAVTDIKKRVFYERNALWSVIKNYEEKNLRRVLPVALLLLLKRAWGTSRVESSTYRLEPALTAGQDVALASKRKGLSYYLHKAWWIACREGLLGLYRHMMTEVRRRRADPTYDRWLRRRKARPAGAYEEVPAQALSYLVAANDILNGLARMMEKRQAIQAARRRPDSEILPLFQRPFDLSYADPEYEAAQRTLERVFGLESLFGEGNG